jgi:protein gp37
MAETSIEWTERSWNPVVGCSVLSPGCTNCYAMQMAARLEAMGRKSETNRHYAGTTRATKAGQASSKHVWTGKLALAPDSVLLAPLRRRKPTTWFVNSMGDLFHEDVPDEWIDRVFAVMALGHQHTYQVLTKRGARMRAYLSDDRTRTRIAEQTKAIQKARGVNVYAVWCTDGLLDDPDPDMRPNWPLPNVWLGVSAEDQRRADERIPELLATPAAIRFVSAEPLLGPIDFEPWLAWQDLGAEVAGKAWGCQSCDSDCPDCPHGKAHYHVEEGPPDGDGCPEWMTHNRVTLDWIIVGGESGQGARPMHPDWARQIRDQCAAAGTAFFFKQWGEWAPGESCSGRQTRTEQAATFYDEGWTNPGWHFERISVRVSEEMHRDDEPNVWRVGKKRAGRLLDGALHDAMPEAAR